MCNPEWTLNVPENSIAAGGAPLRGWRMRMQDPAALNGTCEDSTALDTANGLAMRQCSQGLRHSVVNTRASAFTILVHLRDHPRQHAISGKQFVSCCFSDAHC